jgi:hypothetical protein
VPAACIRPECHAWLGLLPLVKRRRVLPKRRLQFSGIRVNMYRKTLLWITTSVLSKVRRNILLLSEVQFLEWGSPRGWDPMKGVIFMKLSNPSDRTRS